MSHYSDPTANSAIGAVDREIRQMTKRAEQFKKLRMTRPLTAEEIASARRLFVGIHRALLRKALEEV